MGLQLADSLYKGSNFKLQTNTESQSSLNTKVSIFGGVLDVTIGLSGFSASSVNDAFVIFLGDA